MISEENNDELNTAEQQGSDEHAAVEPAVDTDAAELMSPVNEGPTGPGQLLSRKREALGMTVQQVADELHITMHYVRALESNAHDKLPGDVFIRGYIRSYANLLKLDPIVLINVYNEFTNQQASTAQEASSRARRRKDRNLPWIVVSGIAFVGIAIALWYFNSRLPVTSTAPAQGATSPAPAQAVVTAPALRDGSTPTIDNVATTLAADVVATGNVVTPVLTAAPGAAAPEAAAIDSAATNTAAIDATAVDTTAVETTVSAPATPATFAPSSTGLTTPPTVNAAQQLNATTQSVPPANAASAVVTSIAEPEIASTTEAAAEITPETNAAVPEPDAQVPPSENDAAPVNAEDVAPAAVQQLTPNAAPAIVPQPAAPVIDAGPQATAETRVISVDAGGEDLVQITFNGESMVQVEDGNDQQIYRDIRSSGDVLRITGSAPFNILLGDAAATELSLNGNNIDFTSNIRIDNSVRLTIGL